MNCIVCLESLVVVGMHSIHAGLGAMDNASPQQSLSAERRQIFGREQQISKSNHQQQPLVSQAVLDLAAGLLLLLQSINCPRTPEHKVSKNQLRSALSVSHNSAHDGRDLVIVMPFASRIKWISKMSEPQ